MSDSVQPSRSGWIGRWERSFPVTGHDGAPVTVLESGDGPTVLVVHGGSSGPTAWQRVAAELSDRYRVRTFLRPTYRPDGPAADAAACMAREVGDVLTVASTVDGPLLLVGHSSGGVVALESALVGRELFTALAVYEPPVSVHEPLGGEPLVRARAALDAGDPGRAIYIHLREIVGMPALLVAATRLVRPLWRAQAAQASAQIADDEAIESLGVGVDRYAGLDLPVLPFGGARSPTHLHERLRALAAVLPRAEPVTLMPGVGHTANLNAPAKVAAVLADFAARTVGR